MARCATQRPGSVQYPPAVPPEHDRKRSQDRAGAPEGGIHSKEPRVDEGGDESTHDAGFLSAPLTSPRAAQELELMIASKEKAEIRTSLAPRCHPLPLTCVARAEALSSFGFQFLTEVYLPQKIANSDWV